MCVYINTEYWPEHSFDKMFDELIEVKCFKNNRLQESYVKYFKEIKRLKSLQKAV